MGRFIFDALTTHLERVKVEPQAKKNLILNQFTLIKDRPMLNRIDDRLTDKGSKLAKTPLKYFTEFLKRHVLSSVTTNSSEDVLGRFYGEFIRYSGGDGQSLGVVLTPSHITDLFCDLVDIKPTDVIFDPCCGTGGFLIAGMYHMLNKAEPSQYANIKQNQIHGVEVRDDMFSIATTNMILRGDGKSNLICEDFLKITISDLRRINATVGFINPPYSQAKNKETAHLSEICFIRHLLDGLSDGARCVVIVPQSTMIGKTKEDKKVKQLILKKHTLEGVITLNKNTFYGVGTNPCIAVFTRITHILKTNIVNLLIMRMMVLLSINILVWLKQNVPKSEKLGYCHVGYMMLQLKLNLWLKQPLKLVMNGYIHFITLMMNYRMKQILRKRWQIT